MRFHSVKRKHPDHSRAKYEQCRIDPGLLQDQQDANGDCCSFEPEDRSLGQGEAPREQGSAKRAAAARRGWQAAKANSTRLRTITLRVQFGPDGS